MNKGEDYIWILYLIITLNDNEKRSSY